MIASPVKKLIIFVAIAVGLWLGIKYLLPVALPFLLGGAAMFLLILIVSVVQQRINKVDWEY